MLAATCRRVVGVIEEHLAKDVAVPAVQARAAESGVYLRSTLGFSEAVLVTMLSGPKIHFAPRPLVSLKAQWPDLQWACGPKPATEPSVFCASVPQRSQRILWEVISNSVFDRVVGRAQASKRMLEKGSEMSSRGTK